MFTGLVRPKILITNSLLRFILNQFAIKSVRGLGWPTVSDPLGYDRLESTERPPESTAEASDQRRISDADAQHNADHVRQDEQREHLLVENASSDHPLSQI